MEYSNNSKGINKQIKVIFKQIKGNIFTNKREYLKQKFKRNV